VSRNAKSEMRVSVLTGCRISRVELRPRPQPGPDEVLVRVILCGVCASEFPVWTAGGGGMMAGMDEPVLGHEVVGIVESVGERVFTVPPGTRVTGLIFGGFAEYALAPAVDVISVPEKVADEDAMGEPLSCAISAVRRTRVDLGDRLAIVGLGYMGLLSLMALVHKGAGTIYAVDPRPEARERARSLGADVALAPGEVGPPLTLTAFDQIKKGHGLDVAVEAAGSPAALELAGKIVREHGVLSVIGFHQNGPRSVDMELWNWKALEVLNAHERRNRYQLDCLARGFRLIEAGKFHPSELITHRLPLNQVDEAFRLMADKPRDFVKAVIRVWE